MYWWSMRNLLLFGLCLPAGRKCGKGIKCAKSLFILKRTINLLLCQLCLDFNDGINCFDRVDFAKVFRKLNIVEDDDVALATAFAMPVDD